MRRQDKLVISPHLNNSFSTLKRVSHMQHLFLRRFGVPEAKDMALAHASRYEQLSSINKCRQRDGNIGNFCGAPTSITSLDAILSTQYHQAISRRL
ncbi:hypothetical protein RRF57_006176 [Xylaria bambusicola]|uniref:Uncharacterized protein n=1 Tax=Xylaria bambusicola TaxID=326684 RepID=A0AAN7URN4_9PEZI